MSSLQSTHLELLKIKLQNDFVAHLPPILESRKTQEQRTVKNLSRAFSAFALSQICSISPEEAANSVVDDFDDKGIDAIYYHPYDETLYIVQSKLKALEMFGQDEALSFCQGVRKILRLDLDEFNQHVQKRRIEIEDAIEGCNYIKLVIAYIGEGISMHALSALNDLFVSEATTDGRLSKPHIEFSSEKIINALLNEKAYKQIDVDLILSNCTSVDNPKLTYFGLVPLKDLVSLHRQFKSSLYEKNIRTFLGQKTDVNIAIRNTLLENPEDFLYLHNGVAALCQEINPKNTKANKRKLQIKGISIINGAQTIASASQFIDDNPEARIDSANVLITLIQSSLDSEFGKNVTKARNHQNSVSFYNFAALDDRQERLRRELSYLNFNYVYKAGVYDSGNDTSHLHINEAALALALFSTDPRFTVLLKREPNTLLNINSDQYKAIFSNATAQQIINSIYFFRYIQDRISTEIKSASSSHERLIYKHGMFALSWILAQKLIHQQKSHYILNSNKIKTSLSHPFDELRQIFLEESRKRIIEKGPLAFFKSQADVIPLLEAVSIEFYGLTGDDTLKRKPQLSGQPYPVDLFKYILRKAQQITDLT